MKKMLLTAVVMSALCACNEIEEINLQMENGISGVELVSVGDSLFMFEDSTDIVSPLGYGDDIDDWYQIYMGPYDGVVTFSHTITSPAPGLGSITISYKVAYQYGTRVTPPYDNALIEVGDVYDFKMVRNTPLYLLMQNPNGVAGPINIVPSVDVPLRTITCRAFMTIVGDAGFFGGTGPTEQFVQFNDYRQI